MIKNKRHTAVLNGSIVLDTDANQQAESVSSTVGGSGIRELLGGNVAEDRNVVVNVAEEFSKVIITCIGIGGDNTGAATLFLKEGGGTLASVGLGNSISGGNARTHPTILVHIIDNPSTGNHTYTQHYDATAFTNRYAGGGISAVVIGPNDTHIAIATKTNGVITN